MSTFDITASLPADLTTPVNAASHSRWGFILQNALKAHVDNTTISGYAPDRHNTQHIVVDSSSLSIAVGSSNSTTTLDVLLAEVMTRVHAIEGDGAANWGAGTVPMTLKSISDQITGHTIHASIADTAVSATTADALTAPTPLTSTIKDYKVTVSGANGTLNVAAGSAYIDSAGNYIAAGTATTVTLPSQPTGTNLQYLWITKPTITGTPHASTTGTVGASPPLPPWPTGEEPLALVLWFGATTRPGGVVQAADILDLRFGHGGTGSAGSGTYTPATPVVAVGSLGSTFDLNSFIIGGQLGTSTPLSTGVVPANMRIYDTIIAAGNGANDAPLSDLLGYSVKGNIVGAVLQASATTLTLQINASDPPIVIEAFGKRQKAAYGNIPISNSFSTVGPFTLLASLAGTGPYFTLTIVQGQVGSAVNAIPLLQGYYDGATFYITPPHGPYYPMQPIINAANFQPFRARYAYPDQTAVAPAGTVTAFPGGNVISFVLPPGNWTAWCRFWARMQSPATAGTLTDLRLYVMQSAGSGVALSAAGLSGLGQWYNPAVSQIIPVSGNGQYTSLGGGFQNFGIGYTYAQGGSAASYNILAPVIEVEITRS